jgi:DNA-binding transcriptional LysR family regulator
LSLTEVGSGFYDRCMRILDAIEEARSAAGALQTVPRGRLRINAPVSFGLLHLAPAVTEFLETYPDVSIEMLVNDRVVDLLEGEFDVGVRIGRLRDSSLIARRIAPIRLAICAAPAYLARHGAPKTPDDLANHNCLEYTYFESRGEWRLLDPAGSEIAVPVRGDILPTTPTCCAPPRLPAAASSWPRLSCSARIYALAASSACFLSIRRRSRRCMRCIRPAGISRQRCAALSTSSSPASAASRFGIAAEFPG